MLSYGHAVGGVNWDGKATACRYRLGRQLVNAGVEVYLHARGAYPPLCDADEVVQPAVALVIRLKPADQALPSGLVPDRSDTSRPVFFAVYQPLAPGARREENRVTSLARDLGGAIGGRVSSTPASRRSDL